MVELLANMLAERREDTLLAKLEAGSWRAALRSSYLSSVGDPARRLDGREFMTRVGCCIREVRLEIRVD